MRSNDENKRNKHKRLDSTKQESMDVCRKIDNQKDKEKQDRNKREDKDKRLINDKDKKIKRTASDQDRSREEIHEKRRKGEHLADREKGQKSETWKKK